MNNPSNEFWEFAGLFKAGFGDPQHSWHIGGFLSELREAWNRGGPVEHAAECRCGHCPGNEESLEAARETRKPQPAPEMCGMCDGTGLMEGWNRRDGNSCPECKGGE
jgi:hypothetical protein